MSSVALVRLHATGRHERIHQRESARRSPVSKLANLRTGSVDAVLPCFRDAAVPPRATAGR